MNKFDPEQLGAEPRLTNVNEAPTSGTIDLFDPENLRLSQDFAADLGVKKILLTVPVRKPNRQTFIRTHRSSEYRLATSLLELKNENETYLAFPRCGLNCKPISP